jgi:hypothetical protein
VSFFLPPLWVPSEVRPRASESSSERAAEPSEAERSGAPGLTRSGAPPRASRVAGRSRPGRGRLGRGRMVGGGLGNLRGHLPEGTPRAVFLQRENKSRCWSGWLGSSLRDPGIEGLSTWVSKERTQPPRTAVGGFRQSSLLYQSTETVGSRGRRTDRETQHRRHRRRRK